MDVYDWQGQLVGDCLWTISFIPNHDASGWKIWMDNQLQKWRIMGRHQDKTFYTSIGTSLSVLVLLNNHNRGLVQEHISDIWGF
jgi:hypothetical protein